jgi:hypothetical protein
MRTIQAYHDIYLMFIKRGWLRAKDSLHSLAPYGLNEHHFVVGAGDDDYCDDDDDDDFAPRRRLYLPTQNHGGDVHVKMPCGSR